MKFLMLVKPRAVTSATETRFGRMSFQEAQSFLNAKLADGTLDCVYNFASGPGGVAIGNAESHEELWEQITAYPIAPLFEFEVHPLADINYVLNKTIERMKEMEAEG